MVKRLAVSLLIAFAPIGLAAAQTARPTQPPATTDVPVAKVVLFSSGVGYFEHAGTVRGNGSTELRFKTTQINDILKSIMLQDQDGGRVGAITYPSQDPLAKTLKSFQVDITQNPTLAQLLNQLRGSRVTIQSQAERLTGTIVGVETRRKAVDKGEPVDVSVLNLLTGASIRAVDLQSISNLSLDDAQLEDELTKALAALVQARDQDKKPVTINFAGTGDRRVRIGYVVETPVWKTSYRLLLDDKGTPGRIQGWAIVENQTESDWNGVALSLVSGRPLSFIMDLYQPLYATRPTVVPELFASLRPQVYDGGTLASAERVPMAASPAGGTAKGMVPGRRIGYNPDGTPAAMQLQEVVATGASQEASYSMDAMTSVQALGSATKMGDLFQYTVGNVTLPRQKSAMLPIITDSIELERLSIYNAAVLRTNPLNGVRVKNTTGKHLLQGPVTVLDKGSYAGDARIDNVPPGQERLLSYGIDLDVVVDNTKNSQTSAVVTAKINKGSLIIERKLVSSQEYAADNKGAKDKMLVIEHPIRYGWKLIDTQKPAETTPAVYRFKGNAVAGKVTTLMVKEEIVQAEAMGMNSADVNQLVRYNRTGEIPQNVRDAISKAIQLKSAVLDAERQINATNQQIAAITQEQGRIRENMKTVAPSTQYYERLLAKLNEQESSIESLQKERDSLTAKRDSVRKELEDYLSNLTVG
ncbi:MAG: DUF4139 domain-containing protein [bacterium]